MQYIKCSYLMVMFLFLSAFFVFTNFVFENVAWAASESDQLAKVGDTIKPFRLKRLVQTKSASTYVNVEDYVGSHATSPSKVLLLGFYASWCSPCQKEFVHIQKMAKKYGKEGLSVLVIDVDDDDLGLKNAKVFVKKQKPTFPVLSDKHHIVAGHFFGKSLNLPSIYLVTGDGIIRYVSHGGDKQTLKQLTAKTHELLKSSVVTKVATAKDKKGIVVWKLKANEGIKDADVNLLSNFVTNQVAKHSGAKVISEDDIQTILKGEATRQQCGAEDTTCVAEIGNALGVPEAVSGDIGKLGDIWMLNLRRINVHTANVIARSSRQVEGQIDDLLLSIPSAVAELFGMKLSDQPGMLLVSSEPAGATVVIDGKQAGITPFKKRLPEGSYKIEISRNGYFPKTQSIELKAGDRKPLSVTMEIIPMNPYKQAAYGTFFSGLGLVALGGIATWQAKEAGNDFNYSGSSGDQSRSQSWTGAAIAGYTIGGAAMITGVVLWILDPGDLEWAKKHQLSVAPAPDGRGMALSFSGRW